MILREILGVILGDILREILRDFYVNPWRRVSFKKMAHCARISSVFALYLHYLLVIHSVHYFKVINAFCIINFS